MRRQGTHATSGGRNTVHGIDAPLHRAVTFGGSNNDKSYLNPGAIVVSESMGKWKDINGMTLSFHTGSRDGDATGVEREKKS